MSVTHVSVSVTRPNIVLMVSRVALKVAAIENMSSVVL